MTGNAGRVDRLACLKLRSGNHRATYSAALPGLAAWVSCNALRPSERGGDLYYLSAGSHGSMARVVIADVSGHREMVSTAAVRLRDALRQQIHCWDQSVSIRDLNDSFFLDERVALKTPLSICGHEKSSGHPLRPAARRLSPKLVSRCRPKMRNSQWSSPRRVVNSCENRATISLDLLASRLQLCRSSEGSGAALRETGRNERDTGQPESLSTKGEFESEKN